MLVSAGSVYHYNFRQFITEYIHFLVFFFSRVVMDSNSNQGTHAHANLVPLSFLFSTKRLQKSERFKLLVPKSKTRWR